MTEFNKLKTQAEIDAEEDRRAQVEAAFELVGDLIGVASLVGIVWGCMCLAVVFG